MCFLGPKETLPIIISSLLSYDQEKELIHILSHHKGAIGWSVANLQGISPTICMHRINLEDHAVGIQNLKHIKIWGFEM